MHAAVAVVGGELRGVLLILPLADAQKTNECDGKVLSGLMGLWLGAKALGRVTTLYGGGGAECLNCDFWVMGLIGFWRNPWVETPFG